MDISNTLLSSLAVVLYFIGSTLQSEPPAEPIARTRSRSPTLRRNFPSVFGFKFEDLGLVRLRPYTDLNRVFELRRYVFPPDKPIGLRINYHALKPIPTGEHIVLSTSNGDIYAILKKKQSGHRSFSAVCKSTAGGPRRAKINMNSGAVEELTKEEIEGCPVANDIQIAKSYAIFRAHTGSSHTGSSSRARGSSDDRPDHGVHHCGPSTSSPTRYPGPPESPVRARSRSPTLRENFLELLGYKFGDLESIRLIPHDYEHRIFRLRMYVFPTDKPIGLKTKIYLLDPMPPGDQIVLSTFNDEVYAILLKSTNGCSILRPIYTITLGIMKRVKINMNGGAVEVLSTEENAQCPVTHKQVISKIYKVFHV